MSGQIRLWSVPRRTMPASVDDGGSPTQLRASPVLGEDRPERLIEVLAVAQEGLAQDPLARGADLPQRAVAAAVQDRRACLEAVRANRLERELHGELRAVDEHARAPELRGDRK